MKLATFGLLAAAAALDSSKTREGLVSSQQLLKLEGMEYLDRFADPSNPGSEYQISASTDKIGCFFGLPLIDQPSGQSGLIDPLAQLTQDIQNGACNGSAVSADQNSSLVRYFADADASGGYEVEIAAAQNITRNLEFDRCVEAKVSGIADSYNSSLKQACGKQSGIAFAVIVGFSALLIGATCCRKQVSSALNTCKEGIAGLFSKCGRDRHDDDDDGVDLGTEVYVALNERRSDDGAERMRVQ